MDKDITPSPLPGGADVTPSDGQGTATPEVVQLKDVLSTALGKEFKDDQSALKAVKDTFAYVGKAGKYQKAVEAIRTTRGLASDEDAIKYIMDQSTQTPAGGSTPSPAAEEVLNRIGNLETELKQAQFYNEHPEYKEHKALIARFGADPAAVVESADFKGLFGKLQKADELEKSKSVIHSNPRLGIVTDKVAQSRESLKSGDQNAAKANALAAVNEMLQK